MWNFVWLSESWPLFSNQKILHELPDFRKSERSANKWPAFLLCKIWLELSYGWGFPGGSDGKESACNAETQVWLLGQEDPWERKWLSPPTHSILLAWRILWTKEPGGLQFMRSQRVGHNWASFTSLQAVAVPLVGPTGCHVPTISLSWVHPLLCWQCSLSSILLLSQVYISVCDTPHPMPQSTFPVEQGLSKANLQSSGASYYFFLKHFPTLNAFSLPPHPPS